MLDHIVPVCELSLTFLHAIIPSREFSLINPLKEHSTQMNDEDESHLPGWITDWARSQGLCI